MRTRQSEEKRHEIKVGALILIGLAVTIFAILSVTQQRGLFQDRYQLKIHMSRVNGLQTGAPVRLAGVRVGSVVKVEFTKNTLDPIIEVVIEVEKKVQQRIRKDSEAHIGTLGLLGDKFIGITMGSYTEPVLQHGDLLKSSNPIDVEKLIDEGVGVVMSLKKATVVLNEIADKINTGKGTLGLLVNDPRMYLDIEKLLLITQKLTDQIESGEGTLSRLFKDPNLYDELVNVLASSDTLVKSISNGDGSLSKIVNDPKFYNELTQSIEKFNLIMQNLEKGEGTVGQALQDKQLYEELLRITTEMDSLIKDVRRNPQRYLKVEIF